MQKKFSFTWLTTLLISSQCLAQDAAPQLGKQSIQAVIAAMTPEEKVSLVMGTGMHFPGLSENKKAPVVGEVNGRVPGAAGTTFAIPRLGIPSIVLADGPAGLRIQPHRPDDSATYFATAFPIGTPLASTWNVDLVKQVGAAIGNEAKEYGVDILLAPALNNQRNPLGGRGFEYYSEDPVISGNIAAAYVNGVQSNDVGTSIKHFALNNHETNRNVINIKVDQRPIREIYLRGFQIATQKSKPWTVMSSYNKINGTYASESHDLLSKILRDEWAFKGVVMSDWFGGNDAVAQMKAGNDLLMPGTDFQHKSLLTALQNKTLPTDILDSNVARILETIVQTPTFKKYAYSNHPNLTANAQMSRVAASEGMVLLKNTARTLPFNADIKKIALFGNAAYDLVKGGTGSGDVHAATIVSLPEGLKQAGYNIDEHIKDMYSQYITDIKSKRPEGNPFLLPPPVPELDLRTLTPQLIAQMADEQQIAIVALGRNSGEFADRHLDADFNLTEVEKQLLQNVTQAFHAKNKKVVVVLNVGGVIETASWRDLPDAILLTWLPGQEAGHAIVDILKGNINPSGKLTMTFPMRYTDEPSSGNFPGKVLIPKDPNNHDFTSGDQAAEIEYTDGLGVGYRYFDKEKMATAYPFGHGLSYTDFTYDDIHVVSPRAGHVDIDVNVTNSGQTAGKEVVQIYVGAPKGKLLKPIKELRAFAKTKLLQVGEKQTLHFSLKPMDMSSFDPERSSWVAEQGNYTIYVGASSQDIRKTAAFTLNQELIVEKVHPVLQPQNAVAGFK